MGDAARIGPYELAGIAQSLGRRFRLTVSRPVFGSEASLEFCQPYKATYSTLATPHWRSFKHPFLARSKAVSEHPTPRAGPMAPVVSERAV